MEKTRKAPELLDDLIKAIKNDLSSGPVCDSSFKCKENEKVPNNYESIDEIMSNFDHKIKKGLMKRLKNENVYAEYPAWNFYGLVWFDKKDKKFKCMVKRYCIHIDTIIAYSLKKIMEIACDKYGYD